MNLLLFTTFVTEELRDTLAKLKKLGYNGVEIPLFKGDICHYTNLKKILGDLGLGVTAVGVTDPEHDISSFEPKIRRQGIDLLKERIDWTVASGGQIFCGPVLTPWGWRPPITTVANVLEEIRERLNYAAESIVEVAEYARTQNVILPIEFLTRWEVAGPNRFGQVLQFVKKVDHPALAVLADSSHEVLDGDGPEEYERCVDEAYQKNIYIHPHISPPARHQKLSKCWLPWSGFLGPLVAQGHVGPYVIEIFDAEEPFFSGVRMTTPPFADRLKVAKDGVETLKAALKEIEEIRAEVEEVTNVNFTD
jgi:sugar phosphate isomerase/epimerase